MSDHQENNKQPSTHYEHGVPVLDVQSEADREKAESDARDQQYKDDQITLNKRLVRATVALVAATIILGIASGIQLWYIHRQWKLTSDGLSKMGDQIWAAKDAAYAAQGAAHTADQTLRDSKEQFSDTLKQMKGQTAAQNSAAMAAKGANDIAGDALKRSQRPWVGITGAPIIESVNINRINAKPALEMRIRYVVKDYGPSPALYLNLISEASFFKGATNYENLEWLWRIPTMAACHFAEQNVTEHRVIEERGDKETKTIKSVPVQAQPRGFTVFPIEPLGVLDLAGISYDPEDASLMPYILGCIAYGDQFSKTVHHTRFCYQTPGVLSDVKAGQVLGACPISTNAD